jgi:hypothetical protein
MLSYNVLSVFILFEFDNTVTLQFMSTLWQNEHAMLFHRRWNLTRRGVDFQFILHIKWGFYSECILVLCMKIAFIYVLSM